MDDLEARKGKIEKFIEHFKNNPDAGVLKPRVVAKAEGDSVTLNDGKYTFEEDLPPVLGGKGTAVGPLQHLLGSLAGCAACMLYKTFAPLTGTNVDSVEVEVESEFDVKGALGIEGCVPDMKNVKMNVTIHSDDDPEKVKELFELWKTRAPVFLCFQKPSEVATELVVKKPGEE